MITIIKKSIGLLGVILVSGFFIYAISGPEVKTKHVNYPKAMQFAGEKVPYHITDVAERLDKEMVVNMNYHSNTILVIKRANRVFPVIEPILEKNGIPDDFKYLAVIESGLVNVVSPAGARGIWQFMPATAKEYGMEVNNYVDERYDLVKATEAACQYLKKAKEKLGSWTLAAAAYNGGLAGISKKIEEQQVDTYYDLLLTEETSRYVFRILALKEIMKNPLKYNFNLPEETLYKQIPTKTIKIDSTIEDLAMFAKSHQINYKILKLYNPWLRDRKLVNTSGKIYSIAIPLTGY